MTNSSDGHILTPRTTNGISPKSRNMSSLRKLPGSRSKWSQCSTIEKFCWLAAIPFRILLCFVNIFCFVFAYFGFMLLILWARKLWPRLYWGYEGKLYMWLQAFVAYWGYTADYDVYEYGDDIRQYAEKGRVLVIVNHQSTADVNILLATLQTKGAATRKTVWLMDVMFRWTPFGIIGQMHGDYFIKQGKSTREKELVRLKKHMKKVFWNRDRRWVILFPEGGFYYKRKETSQQYGRKHNFPHLEWCTLPRTGAIKAILEEVGPREGEESDNSDGRNGHVQKVRSGIQLLKDAVGEIREKKHVKETRPPITHVLDVTIAYPNGQPLSILTLCFGTREPCDIAVHYKMHPIEEVPFNDENKLRDWLYSQYANKDKLLSNYYKFGEFETDKPGERIVFEWSHILGHWTFWLFSFLIQCKIYYLVLRFIFSFLMSI